MMKVLSPDIKNKNFLLVFSLILIVPLIYLNSTISMVDIWMVNETFTHGFLVFPLSLWLIWKKNDQLNLYQANPEPRVFTLLIPAILCWVIASAVDVQIIQQFSMISVIIISVWIILGWRVLSVVLYPLVFLYFAVPFGQSLIPPLMNFTADFTVKLVQLSGIPVYQEGLFFTLSTGSWSVVDECSGVRYLIASFTLGAIYAYLNYSSLLKRLVFILFSLILPIVGNVIRAYLIVLIGHFSGMTLATGVDHLVYGWVFFGILIFLLFYIGSFWRDFDESVENTAEYKGLVNKVKTTPCLGMSVFIIIILLASSKIYVDHLKDDSKVLDSSISIELPMNFSGWQLNKDRGLDWQPLFENPDVALSQSYVFADELVQLNIAYYKYQRQGAEAITTNNRIVSQLGEKWKKIRSSVVQNSENYVSETEIRWNNRDILIWHWYKIGEYMTPDPYIAKAIDAYNYIVKGRTDAAMITLATRINDNTDTARQRIQDFWHEAHIPVNSSIEELAKY
jgi:exosortase A